MNTVLFVNATIGFSENPFLVNYILVSRLGLGINFIQWIPLRSYNGTHFVAVALFVITPVMTNVVVTNVTMLCVTLCQSRIMKQESLYCGKYRLFCTLFRPLSIMYFELQ